MNLSRKRKKELRKLQQQATNLWESQQVLLGEANHVAREAGRQLGKYNREQVLPTVHAKYDKYAAPYVDKGASYVDKGVATSRKVYNDRVVPTAGVIVGSALSLWDAANDTRKRLTNGRALASVDFDAFQKRADAYGKKVAQRFAAPAPAPAPKRGIGAGGILALILGAAAALGVLYAAWQTLRADDELWVADDPLRAPEA